MSVVMALPGGLAVQHGLSGALVSLAGGAVLGLMFGMGARRATRASA